MHEMVLKNMTSQDKRFNETLMAEVFEHQGMSRVFERRIIVKVTDIVELHNDSRAEEFLRKELAENYHPETYVLRLVDRLQGREEQLCKIVGHQYIIVGTQLFIVKISCCFRKVIKQTPCA